jgi:hypothetical protein
MGETAIRTMDGASRWLPSRTAAHSTLVEDGVEGGIETAEHRAAHGGEGGRLDVGRPGVAEQPRRWVQRLRNRHGGGSVTARVVELKLKKQSDPLSRGYESSTPIGRYGFVCHGVRPRLCRRSKPTARSSETIAEAILALTGLVDT